MRAVHVLVSAGSLVLVISRDVHLVAGFDGNVDVSGGIARADFWPFGVKGDGHRAALPAAFGLSRVVDDGLMVLVRAMREVHADDVQSGFPQVIDFLHRVCFWA